VLVGLSFGCFLFVVFVVYLFFFVCWLDGVGFVLCEDLFWIFV